MPGGTALFIVGSDARDVDRSGGYAALRPGPRRVEPRAPKEALDLAAKLRREGPARSAAHIAEVLRAAQGFSPHPRTLERHFKAQGLTRAVLTGANVAYGRFEAGYPNELWTTAALHGPVVGGKKAVLFAFIDDSSRLVTGHRWSRSEDTLAAEAALRRGTMSKGLPSTCYLDNGSPFVCRQLLRALAVLGVRLVHSRPGALKAVARSKDFSALSGNSSWLRSRTRRSRAWLPWRTVSPPGWRQATTAGSTQRPKKRL